MTKRLFLVRHCESTGQEAAAPLTAVGQAQAVRLADYLETVGVDLLVASPHTRAQQSIAPLAQRLGLAVEIEPRLAERVLSAAPLAQWREATARVLWTSIWRGPVGNRAARRWRVGVRRSMRSSLDRNTSRSS